MVRSYEDSQAWRPALKGWSMDILPYYARIAATLPKFARCVELGVYSGRSLLFLREELDRLGNKEAELWGVDLWLQHSGEPEREGTYTWCLAQMLTHARELLAGVHLIRDDTIKCARYFEDASLDLVFIDANHDYIYVRDDIRAWLPKVKPGGILAGHDYDPVQYAGTVRAVIEELGDVKVEGSVWQRLAC